MPSADVPGDRSASPGHTLPVRAPGRTMAAAERARQKPAAPTPSAEPGEPGPARDAGSKFGAFHRARHGGGVPGDSVSPPGDGHGTSAE